MADGDYCLSPLTSDRRRLMSASTTRHRHSRGPCFSDDGARRHGIIAASVASTGPLEIYRDGICPKTARRRLEAYRHERCRIIIADAPDEACTPRCRFAQMRSAPFASHAHLMPRDAKLHRRNLSENQKLERPGGDSNCARTAEMRQVKPRSPWAACTLAF